MQKGRAKKNKNGENFHRGEEVKPVTNFLLLEKKGRKASAIEENKTDWS